VLEQSKTSPDFNANIYLQTKEDVLSVKFFASLVDKKYAESNNVEEAMQELIACEAVIDLDGEISAEGEEQNLMAVRINIL
jgi:hypothetical protein